MGISRKFSKVFFAITGILFYNSIENCTKEAQEDLVMAFTEKRRVLFLGLPWTFTTYEITEELITVKEGLLRKTENDCYMYKVIDVRLETSLLERMMGLGTVHCFGSDVTNPDLTLRHIKNAKEVKDFILHYSEDQRLKRKTINTQNIGGGPGLGDMAAHDPCMF